MLPNTSADARLGEFHDDSRDAADEKRKWVLEHAPRDGVGRYKRPRRPVARNRCKVGRWVQAAPALQLLRCSVAAKARRSALSRQRWPFTKASLMLLSGEHWAARRALATGNAGRGSPALRCADSIGLTLMYLNRHFDMEGAIVYWHACALGCEGIVSKRLGSLYRPGRQDCWIKVKNPAAPAMRREAEEDWG